MNSDINNIFLREDEIIIEFLQNYKTNLNIVEIMEYFILNKEIMNIKSISFNDSTTEEVKIN